VWRRVAPYTYTIRCTDGVTYTSRIVDADTRYAIETSAGFTAAA
jgi:hypothetical protein